uniref:Uncharacterized protein n=1 Tax=Candidatus Methanogaster sp. ANME-2c ERB4 TaxID=2759911 RepID=A0A7G9YF37_9EURY|nr:hypothetical protein OEAKOMNL_00023 [Methanosarcinales archaeon ANME-2c ERB4]
MGNNTFTIIGVIVGIVFGINAISVLLEWIHGSIGLLEMIGSSSGTGLIISIIIAAVLIIKIRIITSLITGALIGIVLNLIVVATQGADIITLLLK